jgi:hypothetical protein
MGVMQEPTPSQPPKDGTDEMS